MSQAVYLPNLRRRQHKAMLDKDFWEVEVTLKDGEVDPRGVIHGMDLGLAAQKKDSTAAGSQPGLSPAPGPPPVPPAQPTDSAAAGSTPAAP